MSIIKKLSREEAQKIAAGEVVERPASVVKELMENSIDAGATAITITVNDGGKKLISCADDGHGMDPIDARLCTETHATSKITRLEDLFTINSFGFRGEALGSLASIAQLSITTKDTEHQEGIRLTVEHNAITGEEVVAHHTGTTIEVHNLFSTVPARLKFLKKNDTEYRHIIQLFNALCLAHPQIHAKLIIDDAIHSHYPVAKTFAQRAHQIITFTIDNQLLPVFYTKNGIVIEGAISNQQIHRFDKGNIYIFVNKRWVKNISLSRAVMRAYTALPIGKFPVISLHITVDPAIIDVNIHPRKEEVAFANSNLIEQAITHALKETLEKEMSLYIHQKPSLNNFPVPSVISDWQPFTKIPPLISAPHSFSAGPKEIVNTVITSSTHEIPTYPNRNLQEYNSIIDKNEPAHATILGQLDDTYIIATTSKGLTIVDQHAAHERILYEQYTKQYGKIDTIQLLFPEIIHLSATDYILFEEYKDLLINHGIIAEQFGTHQIRVTALPVFAKHISAQEVVNSLIVTIHETPAKADAHTIATNALRAQMACKAAVKAGDPLTMTHMQQLLRDLEKTANNLTCPHGRPTCWHISIHEFEKKFQRIG